MKFKPLFKTEAFYNKKYENYLTDLDNTKENFLLMLDKYFELSHILDAAYKVRFENLKVYMGGNGIIKKQLTTTQYENLGKEFHAIKDYYQMLLIACKNKFDFWLNDIMPDKYKTPTKKKRKSKV